jgi:hypothetical protein
MDATKHSWQMGATMGISKRFAIHVQLNSARAHLLAIEDWLLAYPWSSL